MPKLSRIVSPSERPDWDQFQQETARLLRLSGWSVMAEQLLYDKKVDVLAERLGLLHEPIRLAVECKHFHNKLTKRELREIVADYLSVLERDQTIRLLIVTTVGLAPAAETFCRANSRVIHKTYEQLEQMLMDFSRYLEALRLQYRDGGLQNYYIRPRATVPPVGESVDLEETIIEWINGDKNDPVALLGGYGMGKSTFLRRLAATLAERRLSDTRSRIPVLVRLDEIGQEQTLEGLLGKTLTGGPAVANYSFAAFMELNERGRFVVMLDGFDEMQQGLTWDAFMYNLSQLHRLVVGKTRVIIAGRPGVFLTALERRLALRGSLDTGAPVRRNVTWPEYLEYHLLPFDTRQIDTFTEKYLETLRARGVKGLESIDARRVARELRGGKEVLNDLAARPIQLKMLIELLPWWNRPLDNLTRSELYREFIGLLIRRELGKAGRLRFTVEQRLRFARALALWMWERGDSGVQPREVPGHVFASVVTGTEPNIEAVRRDLWVGAPLETKGSTDFRYFPHRSIQEFLVASAVAEFIRSGSFSRIITLELNAEVRDFVAGILRESNFFDTWKYEGTISQDIVDILGEIEVPTTNDLLARASVTKRPWPLVILISLIETRGLSVKPDEAETMLDFIRKNAESWASGGDAWRLAGVLALRLLESSGCAASLASLEEYLTDVFRRSGFLNSIFRSASYQAHFVRQKRPGSRGEASARYRMAGGEGGASVDYQGVRFDVSVREALSWHYMPTICHVSEWQTHYRRTGKLTAFFGPDGPTSGRIIKAHIPRASRLPSLMK